MMRAARIGQGNMFGCEREKGRERGVMGPSMKRICWPSEGHDKEDWSSNQPPGSVVTILSLFLFVSCDYFLRVTGGLTSEQFFGSCFTFDFDNMWLTELKALSNMIWYTHRSRKSTCSNFTSRLDLGTRFEVPGPSGHLAMIVN